MNSKKKLHKKIDDLSPGPVNRPRQTLPPPTNHQTFSNIRLNQWHTNEEIYNILHYFNNLFNNNTPDISVMTETPINIKRNWLESEVTQRPRNGSVLVFDRRLVKNFKKDTFFWKRRKTGGANSVREDRMCLKVNGIESIYGSYSHSSLISTFHRRCYWLLDKPDIVLVHYLQMPNNDTGECLINLNSNALDFQLTKDDLIAELSAMLWPYCLDECFIADNLKLNSLGMLRLPNILVNSQKADCFINLISTYLIEAFTANQQTKKTVSLRISLINFLNEKTSVILRRVNLESYVNSVLLRDDQQMEANNTSQETGVIQQLGKNEVLNEMINNFAEGTDDFKDHSEGFFNNNNEQSCIVDGAGMTLNHENYGENHVKLSMNSAQASGGEKLFLISDWKPKEPKPPNTIYQLIINEQVLNLIQLNEHVLECTLPAIDLDKSVDSSFATTIYIYENHRLFCPPIPFQIQLPTPMHNNHQSDYKSQLFLLERCICIFKHTGWHEAYFYCDIHPTNSDNLQVMINSEFTFEKRVSCLLNSFLSHLNGLKEANCDLKNFSVNYSHMRNIHEGKGLLHLCTSLGYCDVFATLGAIKKAIVYLDEKICPVIRSLENELDIFRLDDNGDTPLALACRHGHNSIAIELLKWMQAEPILPLKWTDIVQKSIDESKANMHLELAQNLDQLFHDIRNEKELIFNNNFRLIESLEDLSSLLTDETVDQCVLNRQPEQHARQTIVSNTHTELDYASKSVIDDISINQIINEIDVNNQLTHNGNMLNQENDTVDDYHNFFSSFNSTIMNENGVYNNENAQATCNEKDTVNIENSGYTTNEPLLNQLTNLPNYSLHQNDSNLINIQSNKTEPTSSIQHPKTPNTSNIKSNSRQSSISLNQQQQLLPSDDQDKKIKTLADNIIAAMPHKIKTNSYSSLNSTLCQQQSFNTSDQSNIDQASASPANNNSSFNTYRPVLNALRRNAASFDESNLNPDTSVTNGVSGTSSGYYSSSARSSLSPVSSLSFQFQQQAGSDVGDFQADSGMFETSNNAPFYNTSILSDNNNKSNDSSANIVQNENSPCSSSFHIDSPPSTAEFCQYFHAASSSSYYKSSIETGFAQLTLTDDEQRELYVAALIIQNAYRRYIQRKKKKIRLDSGDSPNSNQPQISLNTSNPVTTSNYSYISPRFNESSLSRSSSTSLSSLVSNNSLRSGSLILEHSSLPSIQNNGNSNTPNVSVPKNRSSLNSNQSSLSYQDVHGLSDEEEHNFGGGKEDDKQYQAACVIQKYYRRYRQYENLHKYTEAAVKIQTHYRIYKSSLLPTTPFSKNYKLNHYQHPNSIDETSENSSDNIQYPNLANQKQIARKLVNVRPSSRFSPSSSSTSQPATSQLNSSISQNGQSILSQPSVNNANSNPVSTEGQNNLSTQQQQVHHHHHHHFHHHFHKNNNYGSNQQSLQSPQQLEESLFNNQMISTDCNLLIPSNSQESDIQILQNSNNIIQASHNSIKIVNGDYSPDSKGHDSVSITSSNKIQNFSMNTNINMDVSENDDLDTRSLLNSNSLIDHLVATNFENLTSDVPDKKKSDIMVSSQCGGQAST